MKIKQLDHAVRMPKSNFKIWRNGLVFRSRWISWFNRKIEVHHKLAASERSRSYNFFSK